MARNFVHATNESKAPSRAPGQPNPLWPILAVGLVCPRPNCAETHEDGPISTFDCVQLLHKVKGEVRAICLTLFRFGKRQGSRNSKNATRQKRPNWRSEWPAWLSATHVRRPSTASPRRRRFFVGTHGIVPVSVGALVGGVHGPSQSVRLMPAAFPCRKRSRAARPLVIPT
jgi:hypothetical protein